jgi:hypothetical protein
LRVGLSDDAVTAVATGGSTLSVIESPLAQAHYSPAAKAYLDRRVSEGKSRREAIRALKRIIARAICRLWQECETSSTRLPVDKVA